ncbi:MAG: serine/threonine-protein kinase, partial [Gemmatimonadales bacterium]
MSNTQDHDEIDFSALQGALAGTWSIEREIGRGGMGVVFLARDVSLDRPVAIKVLHPHLARRADARDRFLAEARTAGRLSHPHIVPIYAVGETGDVVYFVMGLVDGESLGAGIRREGPIAAEKATNLIREIGWALAHAHAMGVLHRDITLDNVLVERQTGRAVLVDFGIAAEVERAGAMPLVGTPAYIAPELIHGDPPSVQSDLYALAVMSWATLAGRLPFDAPESAATLMLHVTAAIPSLANAAPATPSRIVRAIERSLAKDPSARPIDTE